MKLDDLQLTIRSHNGLNKIGVTTVEQLVQLSWSQLKSIQNIGDKSLSEISWMCIQVLNGSVTESMVKHEKLFPSLKNDKETLNKARKYDKIIKIMHAKGLF